MGIRFWRRDEFACGHVELDVLMGYMARDVQ